MATKIMDSSSPFQISRFTGRTVAFGTWILASDANHARLRLQEVGAGAGSSYSSYHTGGGAYEWLEVTRTFNAAASEVYAYLNLDMSGKTAYFSQPILVFGSYIGSGNYQPIVNEIVLCESVIGLNGGNDLGSTSRAINMEAFTSGAVPKGVRGYGMHFTVKEASAGQNASIKSSVTGALMIRIRVNVANAYFEQCGFCIADSNGDLYTGYSGGTWESYAYVDQVYF
jgi:hypothetical protein